MILKTYYEQKKATILSIINEGKPPKAGIDFKLYNDAVFKGGNYKFPMVLFKYNNVIWNTSSEKEYKADVDFSVFVVLESSQSDDYIESFEIAKQIDEAILLRPTSAEVRQNVEDIKNGDTETRLTTNSALKVREGQHTVEDDYWEKNDFFIWEIKYSTTLIEKEYKKRYTMISNNAFRKKILKDDPKYTPQYEKKVRENLLALGYDLDDYREVEYNGKKLLEFKKINETVTINDTKELVFRDPK